jgi:hypothetical protein
MSRLLSIAGAASVLLGAGCESTLDKGGAGGAGGAVGGTAGAGAAGGTVGDGAAGSCQNPPVDSPTFGCDPTYAAASAHSCGPYEYTFLWAGECSPFQIVLRSTGFAGVTCGYDQQGFLVWAQRCTDTGAYCGELCITSAGAPAPLPSCELPMLCCGLSGVCPNRDAATD